MGKRSVDAMLPALNAFVFRVGNVAFASILLSCCDNPNQTRSLSEDSRALAAETYGADYYVPGWVRAQRIEELILNSREKLQVHIKECANYFGPKECDRQHNWKSHKQTLLLAQIKSGSVKILEFDGATSDGRDTGHALIYRCHENSTCTQGDLGSYAMPAIPCLNRDACERARAALEELIVLARPAPGRSP